MLSKLVEALEIPPTLYCAQTRGTKARISSQSVKTHKIQNLHFGAQHFASHFPMARGETPNRCEAAALRGAGGLRGGVDGAVSRSPLAGEGLA